MNMGLTAERVAERYRVSREDQDAFALESHARALRAIRDGAFRDEITPISIGRTRPSGRGPRADRSERTFDTDEGPRADTTPEALAKLKPAFKIGGTVTAGNSSQMSDGAAVVMVTSRAFAEAHGLEPRFRYVSYATVGLAPDVMGLGPIHAVPKALARAELALQDIDLIELNEAFAAQALAVVRELDIDLDRTNVNGGAIALGHPLGCTGAKLTTQAVHEAERRGSRFVLITMCVGGGMGAAGVFENLRKA
jgi:acetyl-CoA acyltransferase